MEIEHKYLVRDDSFKAEATKVYHIEQGYLSVSPTIRVRIRDEEAFLTIKGPTDASGLSRAEYEYKIPLLEGQELMALAGRKVLTKERYLVPFEGMLWEVDVFSGRHSGLVLAELEVPLVDTQFNLPPWVGEEVTGQRQYYNAWLVQEEI